MRVFVAGATGVIGRALVPRLIAAGHAVVGQTRSAARAEWLRMAGATPVIADAFDRAALAEALLAARPEVVVHELSDIPKALDPRRYAEQMAGCDRLRVEGTRNLVAAALAAGARRMVAQSIAFAYAPDGAIAKDESQPLWDDAPEPFRRTVAALRALESAVLNAEGLEGVVLRYGMLYGRGTAYARDGQLSRQVLARLFPVVGDGGGLCSFVHVEDAAAATVLAVERGAPGIYNVVDDEPAALRDWLPVLAAALGARPPRSVPALVARMAAGALAVTIATRGRGASNARARRELGFEPRFKSWRSGFAASLSA